MILFICIEIDIIFSGFRVPRPKESESSHNDSHGRETFQMFRVSKGMVNIDIN